MEQADILDLKRIEHADLVALNFIRTDAPYVFRAHFRSGLRSRIMEMLVPGDVTRERDGVVIDGIRRFPRARPVKMLRIFRRRFASLAEALLETRRFKILERHLGPDFIARSCEFYVDYGRGRPRAVVLCGIQDFVAGVGLNPWQVHRPGYAADLQRRLEAESRGCEPMAPADFSRCLRQQAERLIHRVQAMMGHDGLIPDLAGMRNLLVTDGPRILLVDINNIHPVVFDGDIPLDDKGYPVLDRSIDALERLGRGILNRSVLSTRSGYAAFFKPDRRLRVAALEDRFRTMTGVD